VKRKEGWRRKSGRGGRHLAEDVERCYGKGRWLGCLGVKVLQERGIVNGDG
jgi:hypothetical protein